MKKIINSPQDVVKEMLEGMKIAYPGLQLDVESNVLYRNSEKKKVGILSGGGSGHEPAHSGYVGYGMLDVAVSGNVFASPDPFSILEGIKHANRGEGVLLVVKNYSGDVMNFTMAADLAKELGIKVKIVNVNDDVAVLEYDARRGIAGTVFVHKIVGAAAEKGKSLDEIVEIAEQTIQGLRSFGFSFTSCTIPEVGKPIFQISEDEFELGMGIHGEPGILRTQLLSSAELSKILVDKVCRDNVDYCNEEVAVLINGLGGTPLMELNILLKDVHSELISKSIKPVKYMVGNYMTSLEMSGASLSLLKLDKMMLEYLEATCDTPALKVGCAHEI